MRATGGENKSNEELEALRHEKAVKQIDALKKYPVNPLHSQHVDLERAGRDLLSDIRAERKAEREKVQRCQAQHRAAAALHARVLSGAAAGSGGGAPVPVWRERYRATVGIPAAVAVAPAAAAAKVLRELQI